MSDTASAADTAPDTAPDSVAWVDPGPPIPAGYGLVSVAGLLPSPIDLAELPDGTLLVAGHDAWIVRVDPSSGDVGEPVAVEHGGAYAPTLKAVVVSPLLPESGRVLAFALTSTVDGGVANQLLRLELELAPPAPSSWATPGTRCTMSRSPDCRPTQR